jgi:hypothetical protein
MQIKLSILIATMPSRKVCFDFLIKELSDQITKPIPNTDFFETKPVEIIADSSMEYNVGVKRNKLLAIANGEYIVFVDDDDKVSANYVSLILEAIKSNSDCIGISGIITTNGRDQRQWHISKEYGRWFTGTDGTYYRTPNHISPVRRELALQAGFPEIAFGEDAEYSRRLLPLLKTETIITEPLYHYDYWSKK